MVMFNFLLSFTFHKLKIVLKGIKNLSPVLLWSLLHCSRAQLSLPSRTVVCESFVNVRIWVTE